MLGLVHDENGKKDHVKLFPEAINLVHEGKGSTLLSHPLWGDILISANTYLNFFGDGAKDAVFNYVNDLLGWNIVHSIELPVLAISGTRDDGIVPILDAYSAMKKLESELKLSKRVKTIVYENAEHSFDGYDDKMSEDILNFINNLSICNQTGSYTFSKKISGLQCLLVREDNSRV